MQKKITEKILDSYSKDSLKLAKHLFPINRSINSPGTLKTLKELKLEVPDLKIKNFAAKSKVLDWKVPSRWEVKKASICRLNGEKVIDIKDSNLHVVSHSQKVNKKIKIEDLKKKIHTIQDRPDAIPYRTSFYKKDWGFCMEHNKFLGMKDKEYIINIDSSFNDQPMNYGEILIPGLNKNKEVLISTYICHPSMANNELSGPVVAVALIKYLLSNKNNFSYRFLFMPETIGSIAYINSNLAQMKKNIFSGLVLTCVGDENNFSVVKNKDDINYLQKLVIEESLIASKKYNAPLKIYDFTLRQSDERQYCSPGVDLPISCFCRSKYASYPEYHSSDDNFNVVTKDGLKGSIEVLIKSIQRLEKSHFPKYIFLGEPNLGKRGLYPLMGAKKITSQVRDIKNFLAYSNGLNSLDQIATLIGIDIKEAKKIFNILKEKELVT